MIANSITTPARYSAYIALGSNMGDRAAALNAAISHLKNVGSLQCTSYLYESMPMYVTDQPRFLNAVVHIKTALEPEELLLSLQSIEQQVGRTASFRNGPRLLDLDILFCSSLDKDNVNSPFYSVTINTAALQIPHPRISERSFVLQPLVDINPYLVDKATGKTMGRLLEELPRQDRASLRRVVPMGQASEGKDSSSRLLCLDDTPLIQGILNVTPDSFSDGGSYSGVETAVDAAMTMLRDGADIIDIGGESTRPGAQAVDPIEEARRVVPVIDRLMQKCRQVGIQAIISIDTRNAATAEQAVLKGASIINDVSGGRHDSSMMSTAARLGVPLVLTHSRRDPKTMASATAYENLVHDISDELLVQLQQADEVLPRWLQMIDPGIGFAKTTTQNLLLLQPQSLSLIKTRLDSRPMLVGASRKRFLGSLSPQREELQAKDRDWATSGANVMAVLGGANILRVHNVAAARQSIDAVQAILRAKEK